jgi:hypothetical protein
MGIQRWGVKKPRMKQVALTMLTLQIYTPMAEALTAALVTYSDFGKSCRASFFESKIEIN